MIEQRQVTLAGAGQADLLDTDDVSGKKSLLRGAVAYESMFGFMLIASTTNVDYELLAGNRTVARGRVGGGGTVGVFPTENTAAVQGPFEVDAGEELQFNIDAAGATSVMAVVERE